VAFEWITKRCFESSLGFVAADVRRRISRQNRRLSASSRRRLPFSKHALRPKQNRGGVYANPRYLRTVADSAKILGCILSTFILCTAAVAVGADSENPYQGIVDRNVFGLKPPTPPGKPEEKKVDLPPITLTGITTILGNKRALMNVQSPGKPLQSFILAEGQRDGDLEVLEIDEKTGIVKVNQSGTVLSINFEKNGSKLPAAVAAPVGPVNPLMPNPGLQPQPTGIPYVPAGNLPSSGLKTIPTRQIRLPPQPGAPQPGPGGFNPGTGGRPR